MLFSGTPFDDGRILGCLNSNNQTARLGATGKFYCGARLTEPCQCCNGYCGPDRGCNCVPCMRLDLQKRKLPTGFLVNKEGYPATAFFYTGHCQWGTADKADPIYCGRKVLPYDSKWGLKRDGHCGPTTGPACDSCKVLSRDLQRYRTLVPMYGAAQTRRASKLDYKVVQYTQAFPRLA